MNITRENNTIIKKRRINLKKLENYDEAKIKLAIQRLQKEVFSSYVCHFDNISYFLEKTPTFSTNHNGCVSECKRLKQELKKIGLETYYVSCKANGFSNPAGDFLVKEAHVFLIYPTFRNGKVYFTIFDPGFRMKQPISFYDLCNSELVAENSSRVIYINDEEYPYELVCNERIDYKHQVSPANIRWKFNPYYQTLNINDFSEQLYYATFSLKLMNYPRDLNKYICIRAKIIDNTLEIYTLAKNEIFTFCELSSLTIEELVEIFKPYFENANLTNKQLCEFINNLFLLIHNAQNYINTVLNLEVVHEYKLGKRLNR